MNSGQFVTRVRTISSILTLLIKYAPLQLPLTAVINAAIGMSQFLYLTLFQQLINGISQSIDQHHPILTIIIKPLVLIGALRTVTMLLTTANSQVVSMINQKVTNSLMEDVVRKASDMPFEQLQSSEMQDTLYFLRNDAAAKPVAMLNLVLTLIGELVGFLSVLTYVFRWSIFDGILVLLSVIPFVVLNIVYGRKRFYLARELAGPRRLNFYYLLILTTIETLKELISYSAARHLLQRHQSIFKHIYHKTIGLEWRFSILSVGANLATVLVTIYVQFQIVLSAITQMLTIGWVTSLFQAITTLWTSSQTILASSIQLYNDAPYVDDLTSFFNSSRSIGQCSGDQVPLRPRHVCIELQSVTYNFMGKNILGDINLRVESGSRIGLIGTNGSGKSTLCELIQGLRNPTSGRVLLNGSAWDSRGRLKQVSMMHQDFSKYELSLADNISISNPETMQDDDLVRNFLDSSGDQAAQFYSERLHSRVGTWFENSIKLSGGQWQRIALYRTLFKPAILYILDEPTASMDSSAKNETLNMIAKLPLYAAVIIVSHDLDFLRLACSEVYELNSGSLTVPLSMQVTTYGSCKGGRSFLEKSPP